MITFFRHVISPSGHMFFNQSTLSSVLYMRLLPSSLGIRSLDRHFSSNSSNDQDKEAIVSDDLRERARQRIAEFDAKQTLSPNSPMGILYRSPGTDPNAVTAETAAPPVEEAKEISVEEAFARFPNNVNPNTGEVRGPTGPEPTRFGDWERKGRCSDF